MNSTRPPEAPLPTIELPPLVVVALALYDEVEKGRHVALRAPKLPRLRK